MSALPRPVIAPSRRSGRKLRAALCRHDVEVPVEVDRPRALTGAAAHDARVLELTVRGELDQVRGEAEPFHGVAQDARAAAEPATGRVLGVDGDQVLQQRGHLVCARPQPALRLGGAGVPSHTTRS